MCKMTVIYLMVLCLLSVQAKVIEDNEINDNHINIDYNSTQKPLEVTKAFDEVTKPSDEVISNSLDDFTKTEVKDDIPDIEKKTTDTFAIDNGTALILTPYIEDGNIEEARKLCEVDSTLFLGIKSYSGFLTVNRTHNSNLFFWYFPGERNEETPWIIWLQGGPGQSSMIGLFEEIGPFSVVDGYGTLRFNKNTWLRDHSLVFIDNPVGAGYSFTDHEEGYALDMATYGAHLHTALRQLVQLFPELQSPPLFIAGESYGGKYVPALAAEIHAHRDESHLPGVNLQGVIVGNGYIDPYLIQDVTRSFYNFGTLGLEQAEMMKPWVLALQRYTADGNSEKARKMFIRLISHVVRLTGQTHAYNFLRESIQFDKHKLLLSQSQIKRAIHVGDIVYDAVNQTVLNKLTGDFLSSANHLYEMLLEHYNVLAYCGQLDQLLPCVVESENFRRWHWSGAEDFRNATRYTWLYGNRRAGYYQSGGRFTEALIVGAGHMAPMDAPGPLRHLVTRWTHRLPVEGLPPSIPDILQQN